MRYQINLFTGNLDPIANVVIPPVLAGYVHNQTTASDTWNINHNLGFKPSVELYSAGSQEIEGDIVHISDNQTIVYFNSSITGFARLN